MNVGRQMTKSYSFLGPTFNKCGKNHKPFSIWLLIFEHSKEFLLTIFTTLIKVIFKIFQYFMCHNIILKKNYMQLKKKNTYKKENQLLINSRNKLAKCHRLSLGTQCLWFECLT